ncbi:hypothetical protein NQZ68_010226 [Dissostichus eleginoides]|nr:hypothetical protein NQZ68_010226 [Dissostichus eleginoides]
MFLFPFENHETIKSFKSHKCKSAVAASLLSAGDERHIETMCFHSTHCDLGKSFKTPDTSPERLPPSIESPGSSSLASNQIFFSVPAAAISHLLSDHDGSNVGIHYHTPTLCGIALFFSSVFSLDLHNVYASGAPQHPTSLYWPGPRVILLL